MVNIETPPQETSTPHRDVIRTITDPSDPGWQEGFELEAGVFIEAGYVDSADELASEYEKYLPASEFILAERDGVVGGSVRVIKYKEGVGFKTVDDINAGKLPVSEEGRNSLETLDLASALEVGTLGVLKQLRRAPGESDRLSVVLFGAIYGKTQKYNKEHVLASFDERFFNLFKMIFEPSVQALGPATDYMGSPTVPALIHVPTLMQHAQDKWPDIHTTMLEAAEKVQ